MRDLLTLCIAACSILAAQEAAPTFKSDVRLVEVYASVLDRKGHYVDGLLREHFVVTDEGRPQALAVFENHTSEFNCALLLDTTGSMTYALAAVKNAAMKLLDEFRESDSVAVYRFAGGLSLLQDFTRDKALAKSAILRTRAAGQTALLDAISAVARDLARRNGKKFIVVFTDGADNASVLNLEAATERARQVGVPVYAVAEGQALASTELIAGLRQISRNTGGRVYLAKKARDVAAVFDDISRELKHTYLLAFSAPPAEGRIWRTVRVSVPGIEDCTVRARQGYFTR